MSGDEDTLAARLLRGEPAALARAITRVESAAPDALALLAAIHPQLGAAASIGVTGPPGAGKSTLVNQLVHALRRRGERVGVVAVDPSSPLSGGAILMTWRDPSEPCGQGLRTLGLPARTFTELDGGLITTVTRKA